MFALGILIGIYSYTIFALGILGILYRETILIATIIFIISAILFFKKNKYEIPRPTLKNEKIRPLFGLFLIMALVNLIGALGPELSFDALWYHLTIPKIFLENHRIDFIPGNLFYYSVTPKLGDMLYIPALALGSEIFAKLIQWGFGILTCFVIYILSRKYFSEKASFFAVLIFYGSLVVAWESTVAYIDLIRTFFELMAVWGIVNYFETRDRKWILEGGVMLGLASATKILALTSLPIFIIFFLLFEKNKIVGLKNAAIFAFCTFLVPFPWLFWSWLNTSNPFYPFFTNIYPVGAGWELFNPISLAKSLYDLFFRLADPISPIYVIVLPLFFVYFKKITPTLKFISIYVMLALIIWYIVPRTGGGRFILPYLPALSILSVGIILAVKNIKLKKYLFVLVIIVCFITIGYRGIANTRYLPVILHLESKDEFLSKNLDFSFGDFYDTDGFFKKLGKDDRVLLYGFHNLYYADFPFIHETYVREGDRFNYIATQDAEIPERFYDWKLIYENDKTNVKVYSLEGKTWHY
jgi:hypothetical protein